MKSVLSARASVHDRRWTGRTHDLSQSITRRIAEEIVETTFDSIPRAAIQRIKWAIMDDVGAAFLGHQIFNKPLVGIVKQIGGAAESTIIGDGSKVPCAQGAAINAEMANTSNFEESGPGVHALSSIAQTALAWQNRGQPPERISSPPWRLRTN